jgi:MFS family permease
MAQGRRPADAVPATTRPLTAAQFHVGATAFLALFAIVGFALYGLPFFYDFMVQEHGWTRREVTSGNAYSKLIVGPLFGFVAGWIVDRFGPKRLMIAGILMAGGALIGLGAISTLTFFYFFYLFNALGYVCGGPLPNQVLLSRWFQQNRGKAMGFAYVGIGVGGAAVPLVAHALTQAYGWQRALQVLGVLMVAVAVPPALFVKEWPAGERPAVPPTVSAPLLPILRRPAFYLLLVGSMCSIGAVGGTMQNLKLYLSLDIGYTQGEIATIASLVLVGSLAGRISMGVLADRWTKKYVMLLIYSIVAAAIPLLFVASNQAAIYTFALVFGIGLGGDYMIIPLMAAELFGVKALGRVMGIVLTADGIAEAVMPMTVATLRDTAGSYRPGFLLLIVLAGIGAAAVAALPRTCAPSPAPPPAPSAPSA